MAFTDDQIKAMGLWLGPVKGSRIEKIETFYNSVTVTNANNNDMVGDGTNGQTMLYGGRCIALEVSAVVNTQGASTWTVTAYKGSISAGNAIFNSGALNVNQTAATVLSANDITADNAGKDALAIGDEIFIQGVGSAAAGVLRNVRVTLWVLRDI